MLEKYRTWQKPVIDKKKGKMRFDQKKMAIWFSRMFHACRFYLDDWEDFNDMMNDMGGLGGQSQAEALLSQVQQSFLEKFELIEAEMIWSEVRSTRQLETVCISLIMQCFFLLSQLRLLLELYKAVIATVAEIGRVLSLSEWLEAMGSQRGERGVWLPSLRRPRPPDVSARHMASVLDAKAKKDQTVWVQSVLK